MQLLQNRNPKRQNHIPKHIPLSPTLQLHNQEQKIWFRHSFKRTEETIFRPSKAKIQSTINSRGKEKKMMLEVITGSAARDYFFKEGSGWIISLFLLIAWVITLYLLNNRMKETHCLISSIERQIDDNKKLEGEVIELRKKVSQNGCIPQPTPY